jgi:hypothetical protein
MKEQEMKKNLLSLGALALVLGFVFAACAQPTEETKSKEEDVILRLYLDRPAGQTLDVGDQFQIRVGTKFAIPAYLKEETYTFKDAANADQTITRYVWRPRVRGSKDEATGADVKSQVPLARATAGGATYGEATWLIDMAEIALVVTASNLVDSATGALMAANTTYTYTPTTSGAVPVDPSTDDISWVTDDTVPAAIKSTLRTDIIADGTANTLNPGKAVYIGRDLDLDPNWKAMIGGTLTGISALTGSETNPWFSVLDNYLPQKGTGGNPNNKYFETGMITITSGVADISHDPGTTPTIVGGVPKIVTKDAYYVDLVLINKTVDDPLKGGSLKKSLSGAYLELEVLAPETNATPGVNGTVGGMDNSVFYMYTKDKHGFNTWNTADGKWNETNDNIKTLSLKPGINEIYLRYFSSDNASEEMHL